MTNQPKPTPLDGVRYYTPPDGYVLTGRDDMVHMEWDTGVPIPLLEEDFYKLEMDGGVPDYDMVGRGIYQALRRNPECAFAAGYAGVLKNAYPHFVSELGGQIVMLDAKEVDTPYLDRKITGLKIMALFDPANAGVHREIARTFVEKGSRLATLHQAVESWYAAEKAVVRCLELDPDDYPAGYEYGEILYVLGRYVRAADVWSRCMEHFPEKDRAKLAVRIAAIFAGTLPMVSPLDYLSAIAVAVEENHAGRNDTAVAILEDVLADAVFCEHFPVQELQYLLGGCYQELGMMDKAAEAFKRS